jgi:pimeloyl-ACP methyl ester carboxylesterase
MIILSIVRFFTTLVSLAILAGAAYLLWTWQAGEFVRDAAGAVHRERETWRLWAGLALVGWSLLGRFAILAACASADRRKTRPERADGQMLQSATGSSLYVETHGPDSGHPVIFTHGWGMDSTFWWYARHDLGERFQLLLWDLPGLGKSRPAGKDAVSLEAFAADLATLVETRGGRKPVLVGHSIGGMIIQTLIRDQPALQDRIAGLVLLNTTYTDPLETMVFSRLLRRLQRPLLEPAAKLMIPLQPLAWACKWQSYLSGSAHLALRLGFGRFVTRSQLEHAALLSTRNPPAVLARGDLAMFGWDATDALGRARIPVLVVGGDKDIVTKLEASRRLQDASDAASLRVVEGANHMGPMERADVYDDLIGDFVLRVQPALSADLPRGTPAGPGEAPRPGEADRPGRPDLR